jgi:hypothetical protein
MSNGSLGSVEEIMQGILKGQVAREIRLFAAQGLLPVPREDLVRLQVVLSADPDPELAKLAASTVREIPSEVIVEWVESQDMEALVLDLLIRIRQEEDVWAVVAQHDNVSDESLRTMARAGTPLVQDIIITNQVRIMGCLEILDELRTNPKASQVVLRRVREFEEEFIAKAVAVEGDLPPVELVVSIEEAIDALRDIGGHIPAEDELPMPEMEEDPTLVEAVKKGGSAFNRILQMDVKEKIICALKGSREERGILIMSRNRLVVRSVLASPKLSDIEVERIAASKSVIDEAIRVISANPKWMRKYSVILALVQNPKAPVRTAMRLLSRLNVRDIGKIARNRNVNPMVSRHAWRMYQQRK